MTSCPDKQNISEFNYENLRKNNLNKIKEYYESVLNQYSSKYSEYASASSSGTDEGSENADFMMSLKKSQKISTTAVQTKWPAVVTA